MDRAAHVPSGATPRRPAGLDRAAARVLHWLGAPFGPSQTRFLCRSLALGFSGAALVGAASLVLPSAAPGAVFPVEVLTIGLAALTGLLLFSGVLDGAPPGIFGFIATWGTILASLAAYGGGSPASGGELFFLWVVPYAFAFFSLRLAWLLTALMAVAYAGVLMLQHHDNPALAAPGVLAGLWFLVLCAEVVVGVLVRRLGRSLRDVDQRFHHAFAHSPVGAGFLTPGGVFLEVNDALAGMLGRRRNQLIGTSLRELAHPDDRSKIPLDQTGQIAPEGELRLLRPDGTAVWTACSVTSITPEVGPAYLFGQFEDITAHKRDREALARRAIRDPLTGLFNRTLLLERLEEALTRSAGARGQPAVILLDLDQFKLVNDSLGHQVGDELLVGLAPRLASAALPGDTLARLGGDEFVVLCENIADQAQAMARAERLSTVLRQPLELVGRRYVVSASIGVALASGSGDTAAGLLRDADAAMYRAKTLGRNRIEAFDESMREEARLRLELERALRSAVSRDELALVYQPTVNLDSGRPISLEALVRWNHPERGTLEPGMFIHLAEETGVIVELGAWVLDRALADLRELQSRLPVDPPLRVNVNVSARQLIAGDFVGLVRERLRRFPVSPRSLGIEITESMLIPDTLPAGLLDELRSLEIVMLLDDFGTGYSSLAYLDQFPIDVLKIDRTFIARMFDGRGHAAVIEAILTMARALSIRVVAEGVETKAQLTRLRELGCAEVQGNVVTPPLCLDEVVRFCGELDTVARALDPHEPA